MSLLHELCIQKFKDSMCTDYNNYLKRIKNCYLRSLQTFQNVNWMVQCNKNSTNKVGVFNAY